MDLPARHSSVAARIALSAGVNRSEFRQSRTARISSGGIPAVVATRQWLRPLIGRAGHPTDPHYHQLAQPRVKFGRLT
jgi:hypothetical protein